MTAWLMGIITAILALFCLWRMRSSEFRARSERPKFRFLENLRAGQRVTQAQDPSTTPKEINKDGKHHS
jgi:hypothetical protein